MTKLSTTKPYAKLADCVGQKLAGVCSDGHGMGMFLAFESAWCAVFIRGDEDEGSKLRECHPPTEFYTYPLGELGLIDKDALAAYYAEKKKAEDEWQYKRDRETYERLKARFETGSGT